MISLNQLDQLISINQAITGTSTAATGNNTAPSTNQTTNIIQPQSTTPVTANTLPFDPNTLMPVGFANNQAAMDTSNTSHNISGGK
jgi:hypothetical protein